MSDLATVYNTGERTMMKRKHDFMARQGDVLLAPIAALPAGARELPGGGWQGGRLVLMHGEVTGHAHAFYGGKVKMFRDDAIGTSYVVIENAPAQLRHEEHSTIELPPGVYALPPQLEYDLMEGARQVAD